MDADKWDSVHFSGHNVAIKLKAALDRNGLSYFDLGNIYHADHAQANGNIAESALDHVYTNYEKYKTKIITNHYLRTNRTTTTTATTQP